MRDEGTKKNKNHSFHALSNSHQACNKWDRIHEEKRDSRWRISASHIMTFVSSFNEMIFISSSTHSYDCCCNRNHKNEEGKCDVRYTSCYFFLSDLINTSLFFSLLLNKVWIWDFVSVLATRQRSESFSVTGKMHSICVGGKLESGDFVMETCNRIFRTKGSSSTTWDRITVWYTCLLQIRGSESDNMVLTWRIHYIRRRWPSVYSCSSYGRNGMKRRAMKISIS